MSAAVKKTISLPADLARHAEALPIVRLNKDTVPCVIAFTLIGAKPFTMGGKKGDAIG